MDETFSYIKPDCSISLINYTLLPYIIPYLITFEALYQRSAYAFKQAQLLFY